MAIGLALVAQVVAFDWNLLRPRLEQYLAEKSHRSVRIGDLQVSLSASLDPTLRLRRVRIDNAAWADARPFIDAGELRATFLLSSLIDRRPVISRLVLIDADVDFERRADGLRNWRLIRPEDRGPTRVRLMSIEAIRSKIRFAHRGLELDVQTAASPVESAQAPFTTRVLFEGTYREAPFAGEVVTGPELTFLETGRSFPLRGHAVSNGARLEVDGEATDLFELAGIEANVTMRSPSLAPLTPLLGKLPGAPALEIGGRLTKKVDAISMPDLNAKIGATRIAGSVSYDRSAEPRRFRAELNSRAVRIEDLRWTAALARVFALARDEPTAVVATTPAASATDRVVPTATAASGTSEPARRDRLDAEIRLQVDRLSSTGWPVASALDLTARLADGVLAVAPVAFGIGSGSGSASGRFDLDTNRSPAQAQLRVDLHDMKLESVLANLPADKRIAGALSGVVDLAARGRTPDEWLASAAGSVSARLHGGSMSRRLDAQIGLSGSRFLRALFTGSDERVPIRCAAVEMELRAGQARARSLLLETEGTHISGIGTANLKSGAFDLLLTPSPERPGLLELRKSIQLHSKPDSTLAYALVDATPQPRPRSCLDRSP